VHKNILMPLGMHRSYFDTTPYHLIGDRANNYTMVNERLRTNGLDFDTGITVSNSGLNAPMPDLGRYSAFLMGDPAQQSTYDRILARSTLEEMFGPQLAMTDPVAAYADPIDQQIGLSFFVVDSHGGRLIGHTGSQRGFRAFLYVDPDAGTAAIAAFNTDSASSDDSAQPDAELVLATVRERVFQELFPLFRHR
jgi:CubicO group peptidase (beta-lactamase class C family)